VFRMFVRGPRFSLGRHECNTARSKLRIANSAMPLVESERNFRKLYFRNKHFRNKITDIFQVSASLNGHIKCWHFNSGLSFVNSYFNQILSNNAVIRPLNRNCSLGDHKDEIFWQVTSLSLSLSLSLSPYLHFGPTISVLLSANSSQNRYAPQRMSFQAVTSGRVHSDLRDSALSRPVRDSHHLSASRLHGASPVSVLGVTSTATSSNVLHNALTLCLCAGVRNRHIAYLTHHCGVLTAVELAVDDLDVGASYAESQSESY